MKEEDIRPRYLESANQKLYIEDAAKLLKHKREFTETPCPACESSNHRHIYDKNGFHIVLCSDCETIFVNPRPTFEQLADHYKFAKSMKYWNDNVFPASEGSRREYIFKPRAKRVAELVQIYKPGAKSLLDVGTGFGIFCEEINRLGIFDSVIGVEPSHSLAETCRRKGINIIEKPIEEVCSGEADVITNFELIEHLYWPKDFVMACGKKLSKGGLLIITTPNVKGFDTLVLGKLSSTIAPPNHLNYFHTKSLSNLLQRCDFTIVEALTPGKLDAGLVRKKILEGEFDVSNNPFLKYLFIDMWKTSGANFQQFLADNGLSSHMWIVAKKN